jgi:integrase
MGMRLTDKVVQRLRLPERGVKVHYDAPSANPKHVYVAGFGVRLSAGGTRSFLLRYRSKTTRQEHVHTIGQFPVWSVDAARGEARGLRYRIDKGGDPQGERQQDRAQPTVADLCDRFIREHLPRRRPSTQGGYLGAVDGIIRPTLGRKLVAAVDHGDIEKLHRKLAEHAPYRANRVAAVASKMFSLAVRWRMRPDNPCKGIERMPEAKRKRYLTGDELARLIRALANHSDQQVANVFRLLLLTGARRGEVLSARWEQFDFTRNVWIKQAATTKQKSEHEVPVGDAALVLLKSMRKTAPEDVAYLFPSHGSTGHLTEVKKAWAAVCKRAGITGLRIHDLRHSFASQLVSQGASLPLIGALLGHSNPITTHRYAHLFDDPQREAVNKVGSMMAGLVAKPPTKGKRKRLQVVSGGRTWGGGDA